MTIRPYTPNDHGACISIFHSNCPAYFDPTELKWLELRLNALDRGELANIDTIAEYFYVLEDEGVVSACGGLNIMQHTQTANMVWGMVDGAHHKHKYGTALLNYRIEQAKDFSTCTHITLDTTQHTFRFFKLFGFEVTKIEKDAYGKGLDRYDMVLNIENDVKMKPYHS